MLPESHVSPNVESEGGEANKRAPRSSTHDQESNSLAEEKLAPSEPLALTSLGTSTQFVLGDAPQAA
ncbi:hypothetical protein E2320_014745, partial [Naja naja]